MKWLLDSSSLAGEEQRKKAEEDMSLICPEKSKSRVGGDTKMKP